MYDPFNLILEKSKRCTGRDSFTFHLCRTVGDSVILMYVSNNNPETVDEGYFIRTQS